jgi:hypothetical protein
MPTPEEITDPLLSTYVPVPPVGPGVCDLCHSQPSPGYTRCYSCTLTTQQVSRPVDLVVPISLCVRDSQLHWVLADTRRPQIRVCVSNSASRWRRWSCAFSGRTGAASKRLRHRVGMGSWWYRRRGGAWERTRSSRRLVWSPDGTSVFSPPSPRERLFSIISTPTTAATRPRRRSGTVRFFCWTTPSPPGPACRVPPRLSSSRAPGWLVLWSWAASSSRALARFNSSAQYSGAV